MKKQWIMKDGIIGTMHTNREGRLVDFKPTPAIEVKDGNLEIDAPKGQEAIVDKLVLKITDVIREVLEIDTPRVGMHKVRLNYTAQFENIVINLQEQFLRGIDVICNRTHHGYWDHDISSFITKEEWYDEKLREAYLAAEEEKYRQRQEEEKRQDEQRLQQKNEILSSLSEYIQSISAEEVLNILPRGEVQKMIQGSLSLYDIVTSMVYKKVRELGGKHEWINRVKLDNLYFEFVRVHPDFKEELSAAYLKKKQAQKDLWTKKLSD